MKNNRLLLALALFAGLQCNTGMCSSELEAKNATPSYFSQSMQNKLSATSDYIKNCIQSIKGWNTTKKVIAASTIVGLTALLGYNTGTIITFINDALEKRRLEQEQAWFKWHVDMDRELLKAILQNPNLNGKDSVIDVYNQAIQDRPTEKSYLDEALRQLGIEIPTHSNE